MRTSAKVFAAACVCVVGIACADKSGSPLAVNPAATAGTVNGVVALASGATATPLGSISVEYRQCLGPIIPIDTGGYYYAPSSCEDIGSLVTSSTGSFTVSNLAPGSYVFVATPPAGSGYHGGQATYTASSAAQSASDVIRITFTAGQ